jgi:4'-phosphopantetheinyl transferase
VWWAGIDDVRPEHDALLADADLARRDRLRLTADRQRLTAAWAVARLVLGAAAGVPPDELRVDRRCPDCGAAHGKPRLSTAPDLQLSVAHSGRCVAVAVARRTPVGVDVEAVVQLPRADLDLLAGGALAGEERAELDRCPAEHRAAAFTTYWTRKEAVLKATGDGLSKPLETLVVSPPSSPPRVLRWPPTAAPVAGLSMHDLHPPTGSVATLAVLTGGPVRVEEYDAGPLLRRAVARPTAAQSSRRLSGDTTRSQRYP